MARIYISSTFEDLKKQRKAAARAVRKSGHTPVSMEDYETSSQKPLDKCLEDVRGCDVFIGIFAWRYGTIPQDHEKSIIHLEYEEAIKNNIPCLIFLLHEDAPWPAKWVATGQERQSINSLRNHLRENHLVCFFESNRELSQKVKRAIKETFSPSKSNIQKRLATILLIPIAIPIAIFLYLKFVSPDFQIDLKPEPVLEIETKGAKTQKNTKGYWEADFGDGIILIYIPAGEFTMGSDDNNSWEKPLHKVYLDGYWIGKTEVAVGQYMKFVNDTKTHYPRWLEPGIDYKNLKTNGSNSYMQLGEALTGDNYPIIGVSWHDAVAYCEWLSKKKGINITLPTEAQWEKAARGTDGRTYPWGNGKLTGKLVNIADIQFSKKFSIDWIDKTLDDGYIFTSPGGSFLAGSSPFGAMDMAGNVWELCQDWCDSGYYKNSPKENPKGPKSGNFRVVRGGCWFSGSDHCRCAYRFNYHPDFHSRHVGFRFARSL